MSLLLGPLGIQIKSTDLVLNGKPQLITPQTVVDPRGTDYESPAPAAGFTAYVLTCEPGAYVYVGNDATLTLVARQNYTLTCAAGAYAYAGNAATLTYTPGAVTVNYALTCDAGAYVYTGRAATLTYASGAVQDPVVGPGSGRPAGIWWGERKIKRGKRLDDLLKKAMEGLIELDDVPAESPAARAVEIVRPFVAPEVGQPDRIDWRSIESDIARVKELLALWQEQADSLEDEEILLMLMA
jgi:hypothetical protein